MNNDSYRPGGFGGFSFFPPVIKNLLIINIGLYILTIFGKEVTIDGVYLYRYLMQYFSLMPLDYGFMPWQLITYQFLHGSFSHILFNMLTLWMFGMEIESLWGSRRFLLFYLLSGIGGGLLQLVGSEMTTGMLAPTIGASGAIFGVMIAFAMMFPDRYIYIYFLLPVKAKYLIGFMVVFNLLAVNGDSSGVAYLCHVGGAISGFLFIMFDPSIRFDVKDSMFGRRNRHSSGSTFSNPFRKDTYYTPPSYSQPEEKVQDAVFYDINSRKDEDVITQADIDAILDKISRSGYKNLSEREKKILFEASKRMQNE
jgi:membrane associated rhomboid family serine protease